MPVHARAQILSAQAGRPADALRGPIVVLGQCSKAEMDRALEDELGEAVNKVRARVLCWKRCCPCRHTEGRSGRCAKQPPAGRGSTLAAPQHGCVRDMRCM